MTPTNLKHAVFETSRHGDGGAMVQIVGPFGTLGIVVPAEGNSEHMTPAQTIEAMRHALAAMEEGAELLGRRLAKIDPHGSAEKPKRPMPDDAKRA